MIQKVNSFSLNAEDPTKADGFIRIGGVQTLPHAGYEVLVAFSGKTLRTSPSLPSPPPRLVSSVTYPLGGLDSQNLPWLAITDEDIPQHGVPGLAGRKLQG